MESLGPELTRRRVISLLVSAVIIVALFSTRTCRHRDNVEPESAASDRVGLVISPYDSIFKVYADTLFDWKLLAAIAYVESKFDTASVSKMGAFGLMQVMPATYSHMVSRLGVDSDSISTSLNVYAAVQQLSDMNDQFSFINPGERINYILASYNSGHGHIFDAMRIARKNGINRYVWTNIEEVIGTMSDEEVYTDSVCRFGRFHGTETLQFVRKVKSKYQEYCQRDSVSYIGIPRQG